MYRLASTARIGIRLIGRREQETLREQYQRASRFGRPVFLERPLIGSPAGPAQAETNTSQIWGHLNSGFLIAYEYTRWYLESLALRQAR